MGFLIQTCLLLLNSVCVCVLGGYGCKWELRWTFIKKWIWVYQQGKCKQIYYFLFTCWNVIRIKWLTLSGSFVVSSKKKKFFFFPIQYSIYSFGSLFFCSCENTFWYVGQIIRMLRKVLSDVFSLHMLKKKGKWGAT